jgi:RHS repeat-associated protein
MMEISVVDDNTTALYRNRYLKSLPLCLIYTLLLLCCFDAILHAQNYLGTTGLTNSSLPYPAEMGMVDAANGNLHLEIPLGSYPQRGMGGSLVPKLVYDSHIWIVPPGDGTSYAWLPIDQLFGRAFGSWGLDDGAATYLYRPFVFNCNEDWMLWSDSGAQHYFSVPGGACSGYSGGTAWAADSSGFLLTVPAWPGPQAGYNSVSAPDGTTVYYPYYDSLTEDSNGNIFSFAEYIGSDELPQTSLVKDTLGRTVVNAITSGNSTTLQVMNSQGGASNYVVTTAAIPVSTNFGESGVTECNNDCTVTVITSIGLPDGSGYSFSYDCYDSGISACNSPSGQSGYYGTLTGMSLPSGATISYSYETFTDGRGAVGRWLTSKNSTTGAAWAYTPVANGDTGLTVTIAKPDGSKDVGSFTIDPAGSVWPTEIQTYDIDGATLLSTVSNTWDFSVSCELAECQYEWFVGLLNGQIVNPHQDIRQLSTTTTLPVPGGSLTKKTTYAYDSPQTGNVIAAEEWKYQPGTNPTFSLPPDRGTYTTYATIGSNNDINRPTSITVCNNVGTSSSCTGGGTPVEQTIITYDGYGSNGSLALQSVTGAFDHDDTNFGSSYLTRGNATQISRLVSGATYLTTAISYDTTGQVVRVLDSHQNPTSYSYADVFYDDNGSDPPANHTGASKTNAYMTGVTDQIGSTSMGYYYGSGQTALSTDYNGITTYGHYVDPFDRPTKSDYAIGWLLNQYSAPSGGQTEIDSYAALGDTGSTGSPSCTSCTHTQALLDSLGRATTANFVNNPAGEVSISSLYDGLNRVYSSSHPYRGSSDPNDVYETTYFDGLGRLRGTLHPDGEGAWLVYGANVGVLGGVTTQSSPSTYGYGFPVVSLDEAGKQRQEWIDGFGHVVEVDEPGTNIATQSTASISVSGSEGTNPPGCVIGGGGGPPAGQCQYDTGSFTVTVGGFNATTSWGGLSTAASVATSLVASLNSGTSPVSATLSGTTITMTFLAPGVNPSFSVTENGPYLDFGATPASGNFTGGSGGLTSSSYVTNYTYDVLGNLTSVIQGSQSRTWQYDGLSRLTQENTPEGGTINLSYVTTSGTLCSGDLSEVCYKVAPAPNQSSGTITTTYSYNSANQLTTKAHSDSTGTVTYAYGNTPSLFNRGRLITMSDSSGSEAYTYDAIGRIKQLTKTIGTTAYTMQYTYNAGGQLTGLQYPSGRVIQYGYDNVGHLCKVATLVINCGSGTGGGTPPDLSLPSANYDAAGRPLVAKYGDTVVGTASYSPLTFELTSLSYTSGSTTLLGLNYYYQQDSTNCPTGSPRGNNGQIQCVVDVSSGTGDSGRSVAYTYDQLGRLLTANTTGSSQYPAWGLAWTYDRYGNNYNQALTAGSGYTWSFTPTANNGITGYTYDAPGNIIAMPSGAGNFTYDGEECMTGYVGNGNNAAYTCDGNHLRVEKEVTGSNAVGTIIVRSGGNVIAEYDNGAGVTSPTREYIYANNLLAIVTGSSGGSGGTVTYQHRDHLSPRLYTDGNGNCVGDQGTYPFGELWYSNNDTDCSNGTTSPWIFTSYERDQESGQAAGNDYALARGYASPVGRFLASDPLEGVVGDPQSWNRYAYVENDPINLSDPSGQGFWEDLGFAIADIFVAIVAPEALEGLGVAEGAEAARDTIDIEKALLAGEAIIIAVTERHRITAPTCPAGYLCSGGSVSTGPPNASSTGENPEGTDPSATGALGQGPGNGGATATASTSSPTPGGDPTGGNIWQESPVPGSRLPNGDVAVGWDFLRNSRQCHTCGNITNSAATWGNATAVALGVVAATATGAIAYEEAPALVQALFGRAGPGPSQINSGLLNSNRLIRIGSGWKNVPGVTGYNVFRVTGILTGGAHLLDWTWGRGMPPVWPPSIW